MRITRHLLWLLAWLPVSCAKDSAADKPAAATSTHLSLSQRLDQKNGYIRDAKGNWVPQNDQRSSFEAKGRSPYFQGKYDKKAYQTGSYEKKSWWGSKDYGHQAYADNTDGNSFRKASHFSQQGARESATNANIKQGPYQTNSYATHAARETDRAGIKKTSDTQTDIRRKVYPAPEIIDWREQRTLSLDQSKGILGH